VVLPGNKGNEKQPASRNGIINLHLSSLKCQFNEKLAFFNKNESPEEFDIGNEHSAIFSRNGSHK
jgi:hypothetical protein